jgi:hypothetical protein
MIIYEDLGNGFIRAVSDNNKYLDEHPTGVFGVYVEAINKGKIVNGLGVFDNGYYYTENQKNIEEINEQE